MDRQDNAPFGVPGTIYLIHFDTPYRHARHYMGFTTNLPQRIKRHKAGHGSRLMSVIVQAGIGWTVVQTWSGDRYLERRIKRAGGLSRSCPICSEKPLYRSLAATHQPRCPNRVDGGSAASTQGAVAWKASPATTA